MLQPKLRGNFMHTWLKSFFGGDRYMYIDNGGWNKTFVQTEMSQWLHMFQQTLRNENKYEENFTTFYNYSQPGLFFHIHLTTSISTSTSTTITTNHTLPYGTIFSSWTTDSSWTGFCLGTFPFPWHRVSSPLKWFPGTDVPKVIHCGYVMANVSTSTQ